MMDTLLGSNVLLIIVALASALTVLSVAYALQLFLNPTRTAQDRLAKRRCWPASRSRRSRATSARWPAPSPRTSRTSSAAA